MGRWTVADVMTADVISIDEDTPFKQIVDLLEAHGINAVPVVDHDHRVLGLVSSADLVPKIEFAGEEDRPHPFEGPKHRHAREKASGTAAAELMTSPAITVAPGATIVATAKKMEGANLKRLPVVDDAGRLVGMVTRGDLLKVFLRNDADIRREIVDEVMCDLPGLDRVQLQVEVDDGVVTLLGQVDHPSLIAPILRRVESVPGVVDLVSYLTGKESDLVG